MRMNAVLSNPKHPEYGQFTVPLPIPHNQYDGIMEALNAMDMGDPLARDCQMDEILGEYPILKRLEGKPVNIDELDYLAKRLDSFCYAQEGAQFQGAAVSYDYSDMTDLINLTFSCQQVTVITDFSDLEQVGRDHYMVLNGGCASKEELDALDGYETALLLIDEGNGVITPYGVVYDNGMRLSQLYDGRHFPQYFYEPPLLTLTVQQSKDAPKTWLYLPAPDLHIKRSLVRAGIVDPADMRLSFQGSEFPDAVDCVLDMESECLEELNKLCQAIQQLSTDEIKKLGAVVEYARPETVAQVRQLAENLEQFDYAPGVQNVEECPQFSALTTRAAVRWLAVRMLLEHFAHRNMDISRWFLITMAKIPVSWGQSMRRRQYLLPLAWGEIINLWSSLSGKRKRQHFLKTMGLTPGILVPIRSRRQCLHATVRAETMFHSWRREMTLFALPAMR